MKKWMLVLFVALFVLPCSRDAEAAGRKKKGKNAVTAKVVEKKSAYDKLFQKKSCETVKSNFITLHKVDREIVFRDSGEISGTGNVVCIHVDLDF